LGPSLGLKPGNKTPPCLRDVQPLARHEPYGWR